MDRRYDGQCWMIKDKEQVEAAGGACQDKFGTEGTCWVATSLESGGQRQQQQQQGDDPVKQCDDYALTTETAEDRDMMGSVG